jgi:hypothetical protein
MPVYVNRTAAHALHNAGLFERSTRKASQNERLLGPDVLEYAKDFNLEVLDTVTGEDRFSDASHAGLNLVDGQEGGLEVHDTPHRERRQGGKSSHDTILDAGSGWRFHNETD